MLDERLVLRPRPAEKLEALSAELSAAIGAAPGLDASTCSRLLALVEQFRSVSSALERMNRSVLDAAPDGITVHDARGRIVEANETACQMFGYQQSELLQLDIHALNPGLPDDHMDHVWQQLVPGVVHTVQSRNVRADGSEFPVEVRSNAFIDGERRYVVALARDMSHREIQARELDESESRYRALVAAIDKGVTFHDANAKLVSANAAAMRILGIDPASIGAERNPRDDWELYDENSKELAWSEAPVARALREGKRVESQVIGVYLPQFPRFVWLSVTAIPQFYPQHDTPFQVISVFSDVTDLKRAAEFFEETQRLSRIGCWELNVAEQQVYWSNELYRICGRDPYLGVNAEVALGVLHPDEQVRMKAWWIALSVNPEAFDLELRAQNAAGALIWLRVIGRPQYRRGVLWRFTGTAQEITRRKLNEEKLQRQAQTDPLTGLLNRDSMLDLLAARFSSCRPGQMLGVLQVDLDRFKFINSLVGHNAGDLLLVACARRLRGALSAGTEVCRYGGDEFLVLVAVQNKAELWALAQKLTDAFDHPFHHQSEDFVITPSIGAASYPEDGHTVQLLLNHVDAAVAEAKRRGRNTWQAFSPGLALQLRQRLQIEAQLRRALDADEFYLLYQPKVNLRTGALVGVEALLRWRNRALGELSPELFIPHAESTGDIVQIGAWVLRESCRQLACWRAAGLVVPHVAVNVSFRQFLSDRFERHVEEALQSHGLNGESLEIEMTERVLIEDAPDTEATLNALRKLGVTIMIDDFGEGYSALGYLRRLRAQGIKISHHFMRGIPDSDTDSKLCDAIIHMAQSLGLHVVAEGVETPAQCDYLLKHGAEVAQGFMFSAPLEPDALKGYLGIN